MLRKNEEPDLIRGADLLDRYANRAGCTASILTSRGRVPWCARQSVRDFREPLRSPSLGPARLGALYRPISLKDEPPPHGICGVRFLMPN